MQTAEPSGMLRDTALPAARLLVGDEAGDLLASAVHAIGGTIERWTATQVRYTPGRRLAVRYRVECSWPGTGPGVATYVALHQAGPLPEGATRLSDGDTEIAVWAYPHDSFDRELLQEAEELRALSGGTDPATGQPFGGDVARILELFLQRSIPAQHETFVTYLDGQPYLRSRDQPPVRLDRMPELTEGWAHVNGAERGTLQLEEVGTVTYQALPLRVDGGTRGVFVSAWFRDLEAEEINSSLAVGAVIGVFRGVDRVERRHARVAAGQRGG